MQSAHRLVLALSLSACLYSCSSKAPTTDGTASGGGRKGPELFTTYCALCHGETGGGTAMNLGPSYRGIAKYWNAQTLLEYVDDPQAFAAGDERLGQREMAALPKDVTPEERERLVEHALSLMD